MENKLITIEELEVGDEILMPSLANLKYLKILVAPQKRITVSAWQTIGSYKSVKCSTKREIVNHSYDYTDGQSVLKTRSWSKNEYICTEEDHNEVKYFNLSGKTLWLVKKNLN